MTDMLEPLAGRRVLVVDDSIEITALIRDVFAERNAVVTIANSGSQAMLLIQFFNFDLVLLDIVMPAPDGWDLLEFMRTRMPDLLARTILLTGDRYSRETLRRLGETRMAVVYKPFDLEELWAVARNRLTRADRTPAT